MLVFLLIAKYCFATFFCTVEIGLLEEVQVFSLDFFLLELLSTEWAFFTFLHPFIDTFFAECCFTVLSTTYHVFRCNASTNCADKLFYNSFVLVNSLVNRQLGFHEFAYFKIKLFPFLLVYTYLKLNLIDLILRNSSIIKLILLALLGTVEFHQILFSRKFLLFSLLLSVGIYLFNRLIAKLRFFSYLKAFL